MKEQNLYKAIQANHSRYGVLFRNNTGVAYQGKKMTYNGRVVINEPRPVKFGLCIGSSDLIGWTEITITPDMVGKKIAVFTAVEVKTERGKISKEQINFIKQVRKAGGYANVSRMVDDELINEKIE